MPAAPDTSDAIRYEGVSFSYDPSRNGKSVLALDNISLSVRQGERLGILGPNGGGKSTLVKLTLGLLRPLRGQITILGRPPHEASRAGLLGYVAQRNEAELAFPLNVRQVVSLTASRSLAPWRPVPADARESVERALELVGVADLANRPIGALSGGQLQRVMIARALAGRPRILLLDEPTVGIDPAGQHRFGDLIRSLADTLGITIILVSHDIRAVAAACDRVACLSRTLHFHAAPAGLTPEVLAEVFQHDVAAIFGDIHVHAHPAAECHDPAHEHGHSHG